MTRWTLFARRGAAGPRRRGPRPDVRWCCRSRAPATGDSPAAARLDRVGPLRIAAGDEVCVEATDLDGLAFARTTFDSSMRYRSAVVHGVAEEVPRRTRRASSTRPRTTSSPGVRTAAAGAMESGSGWPRWRSGCCWRPPASRSWPVRRRSNLDDDEPGSVWAGIVALACEPVSPPPCPTCRTGSTYWVRRATLARHERVNKSFTRTFRGPRTHSGGGV